MGKLKVRISFSQRETMTATESVLSKDIKIIPVLKDFKFTDQDGRMIRKTVEEAFGKVKGGKRYLARKRMAV